MINKDFYPTPKEVIDQMLMNVNLIGKVVLEPSAGKGDIVDYVNAMGVKEVIACEIEPELAKIIASKCNLIGYDFLSLKSEDISHVDYIIMNPPFSADEQHIMHAWEIAPSNCTIISLCNLNTVNNTYSRNRKVLKEVIENNGEFRNLGDCFKQSERYTEVSVACVILYKQASGEAEFDGYFSLAEDCEQQENGIMRHDTIREIVNRYVGAVKLFDEVNELNTRLNILAQPIGGGNIKFGAKRDGDNGLIDISRESYKKQLQKTAWLYIFNEMKMERYVTKGVRENINKFIEQQQHVPFTMVNVYRMIGLIMATDSNRMQQTLVEAFDKICSFSAENSTAGEKWKTNSDYMINKRFIVPHICEGYFYSTKYNHLNIGYSRGSKTVEMEDIVKALCFLTGSRYEDMQDLSDFVNYKFETYTENGVPKTRKVRTYREWGKWHEWDFFRIRGYMKGTLHCEFKDENVWHKFNYVVAKIKGWQLPKARNNNKKEKNSNNSLVVQ